MQTFLGCVPLARKVTDVAGRSPVAKIGLIQLMAYLFLWVPDLDFLLLDLLHHRSIVTHSVLPALVFIFLGWRAGAAPIAGALVGIAVHLSCDLLSPMVGFGQIWLPEPYQIPLGPFSYPWLAINALLAFIWAKRIVVRSLPAPYGDLLAAGIGRLADVVGARAGGLDVESVGHTALLGLVTKKSLCQGRTTDVAQTEEHHANL
jgi:hypothetical protein